MRSHLPCGACAALVPAATGCQHYRPKTPRPDRERQRAYEQAARARAVEAVASFRRSMRLGDT